MVTSSTSSSSTDPINPASVAPASSTSSISTSATTQAASTSLSRTETVNASAHLTHRQIHQLNGTKRQWDDAEKLQKEGSYVFRKGWQELVAERMEVAKRTSEMIINIEKISASVLFLKTQVRPQVSTDGGYLFQVTLQLAIGLAAKGDKEGVSQLLHTLFDSLPEAEKAKSILKFGTELLFSHSEKPGIREVAEQVVEMARHISNTEKRDEIVSDLLGRIAGIYSCVRTAMKIPLLEKKDNVFGKFIYKLDASLEMLGEDLREIKDFALDKIDVIERGITQLKSDFSVDKKLALIKFYLTILGEDLEKKLQKPKEYTQTYYTATYLVDCIESTDMKFECIERILQQMKKGLNSTGEGLRNYMENQKPRVIK